ncbi:hypothetical protein AWR27_17220 [Spirosoma montaniterrae]|uniref:HTH araC/xylS-type domain-containing protein n=1 Tax=Spirosoma montaniterrae TaxID=1178516 RepID=A0A1P9WZU1_9BACT|nr:hypothetical protein AWR27_17220 [Spirosoma montaniterrae]
MLPISEKEPLIINSTIHVLDRVDEGWFFPAGFFRFMLYVSGSLFWLAQVWVVCRMIARNRTSESVNQSLSGWLIIYTILQALLIFPALGFLLLIGQQENIWLWYTLPASLIGLVTGGILFLKPAILYGPTEAPLVNPLHSPATDTPVSIETLREELPQGLVNAYSGKLRFLLEEKQVFLQPNYTLPLLSQESGIPLHQLSAFINRYENVNFNEYINRHRIRYAQSLLADPTYRRKTLEAIARESGFNTRASFISAFKKTTGHTPSEHLRTLK